jgi:hypothetical protein
VVRRDGCFTLLWPLGCSLAFLLAVCLVALQSAMEGSNV